MYKFLTLLVLALLLVLGLNSCCNSTDTCPKYKLGEVVYLKPDSIVATITNSDCSCDTNIPPIYNVRLQHGGNIVGAYETEIYGKKP